MLETKQEWKVAIQKWQVSGQSGRSWCRDQGLVYSQFNYWKKQIFKTSEKLLAEHFVEVTGVSSKTGVEILFRDFQIKVSQNFDPLTLMQCLQVLRRIS